MISHLNQSITDVIFIIMHDQQGIYFFGILQKELDTQWLNIKKYMKKWQTKFSTF